MGLLVAFLASLTTRRLFPSRGLAHYRLLQFGYLAYSLVCLHVLRCSLLACSLVDLILGKNHLLLLSQLQLKGFDLLLLLFNADLLASVLGKELRHLLRVVRSCCLRGLH